MKRAGDVTPEPPGGRAAERLRMFEDARRPPVENRDRLDSPRKTTGSRTAKPVKASTRSRQHAKQARRKK
jgi:hypothetical protein